MLDIENELIKHTIRESVETPEENHHNSTGRPENVLSSAQFSKS